MPTEGHLCFMVGYELQGDTADADTHLSPQCCTTRLHGALRAALTFSLRKILFRFQQTLCSLLGGESRQPAGPSQSTLLALCFYDCHKTVSF